MFENLRRWLAAHPRWALTLATLAALVPFLAKPFNIDDPLFLWAAKQIQLHPLDPYGFNVNWYGVSQPMWSVTENPPLACYFLALSALIFGWSEVGLHTAYLLPALAVVWGTWRLAQKFCTRPLLVALLVLFAPLFLVSATTLMCDVLMLAFWVWAVVFWLEGVEQKSGGKQLLAACLMSLSLLAKYYGICLVPLLAAYSLIQERKLNWRMANLLIPLAALAAFELLTKKLYGHALFVSAADYAQATKGSLGHSGLMRSLQAFGFVGAGIAAAVFLAPWLWSRRTFLILAGGVLVVTGLAVFLGALPQQYGAVSADAKFSLGLQAWFWIAGAILLLIAVGADLARRRDATAWLLALWIGGTLVFAAYLNWTVNARSLLPLVPALAILVARRLERNAAATKPVAFAVALGALLGMAVAHADFLYAIAVRQSAAETITKFTSENSNLWFQGHWGFQFYMEQWGAFVIDTKHPGLKPGDNLAMPLANTSLLPIDPANTELLGTISVSGPHGLSTWNPVVGGGFYAAVTGPLPFAFGRVPAEQVAVYKLKPVTKP
jgi:hypothetical protein